MTHVLLIEDNPGDARLIRELYSEADSSSGDYEITHVQRIRDAIQLLANKHKIDVILSDITLPDSEGLNTLSALERAAAELPVIFMTGTNNENLALAAMKAGAQDYLVKGHIEADVLGRSTRYAIERKHVQNDMARALQQNTAIRQRADVLSQQKKQLIALNHAKDDFISLSSHQLRTPATGVKQYLGMILEGYAGEVPEHLLVFLRTAYDSNERQLTIINDLLKTAQLDSGRYELNKQPTNICALIQSIIEDYRPIIGMRNQKIVTDIPTQGCTIAIDAAEMKLALANLVENSSKYSPSGTTITIRIGHSKTALLVAVIDQGVGISKENTKKIFDKFTRIDNELSDTVNGNGLGLYFVKRIVRMHGGKLDISSTLHKGSTFAIKLPYE